MDAVLASVLGFLLGALVNYILNYHFTFNCTENHSSTLTKFIIVLTAALLINSSLMYYLHHHLELPYLLSQVIATVIVLGWNFTAHKSWTYKPSSVKSSQQT